MSDEQAPVTETTTTAPEQTAPPVDTPTKAPTPAPVTSKAPEPAPAPAPAQPQAFADFEQALRKVHQKEIDGYQSQIEGLKSQLESIRGATLGERSNANIEKALQLFSNTGTARLALKSMVQSEFDENGTIVDRFYDGDGKLVGTSMADFTKFLQTSETFSADLKNHQASVKKTGAESSKKPVIRPGMTWEEYSNQR